MGAVIAGVIGYIVTSVDVVYHWISQVSLY